MRNTKPKLKDMRRVLCAHDWTRLEDWVRNLEDLADLSDDEIVELERLAPPQEVD